MPPDAAPRSARGDMGATTGPPERRRDAFRGRQAGRAASGQNHGSLGSDEVPIGAAGRVIDQRRWAEVHPTPTATDIRRFLTINSHGESNGDAIVTDIPPKSLP
jgi:hypothetical protein